MARRVAYSLYIDSPTTTMQTTTYLVTVTTAKPVTNLPEKIGSRTWTIDGVADVTVQPVDYTSSVVTQIEPTGPAV